MKAPISDEIAKVLRNESTASKLVSEVIKARSRHMGVSIKVGSSTKVYTPAGVSLQKRK